MLKELNRIAAALLGLHGYPTQPWTPPAEDAASGRNTKAAASSGRNGETRKRVSRRADLPMRAWR
jgi:hypothetical protein